MQPVPARQERWETISFPTMDEPSLPRSASFALPASGKSLPSPRQSSCDSEMDLSEGELQRRPCGAYLA